MDVGKSHDLQELVTHSSQVIQKAGQFYRDSPGDTTLYSVDPGIMEILTLALLNVALPILLNIETGFIMARFEKAKKKNEAYLESLDKEEVKSEVNEMLENILPGVDVNAGYREKAIDSVSELLTYHGVMKRKAGRFAQEIIAGIEKRLLRENQDDTIDNAGGNKGIVTPENKVQDTENSSGFGDNIDCIEDKSKNDTKVGSNDHN